MTNLSLTCLRVNRTMRRNKVYIRWALPVWIILVAVLLLTSCAPESTHEPIMTTEPEPAVTASPVPVAPDVGEHPVNIQPDRPDDIWIVTEDEGDMPYVIVTPKPQWQRSGSPSDSMMLWNVSSLSKEIFELTNDVREQNGLNRLTYAEDLQDEADTRAYECSVQFSHTRPDGSSCHDIVTKDYYVTGENLILVDKPIASAENIMARWMLSKGHRDNILLPEFTELAVGVYEHRGTVYAAQIFLGE